jgi:chemotaxis protein methyltransferase CheR
MSVFQNQAADLTRIELQQSEFNKVRTMLHDYCGIYIQEGKEALVKARLLKRIRFLKLSSIRGYLDYMEHDASGAEFLNLVDVLTTNKTSFFRENQHFDFLRTEVLPKVQDRSLKWWSAGCSSGEEPITCAITWLEERKENARGSLKILATDISQQVLQTGKQGVYTADRFQGLPGFVVNRYFSKIPGNPPAYQLKPDVRRMISYARLNLKESWPMNGPFHVIMCRNVMIYFNRETQQQLVSRFQQMLEPGGYLFLGHSEGLQGSNPNLRNIRPAVYQKIR